MNEAASLARLAQFHPKSSAVERMPAIVDDSFLPDMGRMTRVIALGRKSWLFAGSERGGERAALMYSLIVTAKLNDIDPQAWLADVLGRLPT